MLILCDCAVQIMKMYWYSIGIYMHRTEMNMNFEMVIQNSGEKVEMKWNKSV